MSIALHPFPLDIAPLDPTSVAPSPEGLGEHLFAEWCSSMYDFAWPESAVEEGFFGYCAWVQDGPHADDAFEVDAQRVILNFPSELAGGGGLLAAGDIVRHWFEMSFAEDRTVLDEAAASLGYRIVSPAPGLRSLYARGPSSPCVVLRGRIHYTSRRHSDVRGEQDQVVSALGGGDDDWLRIAELSPSERAHVAWAQLVGHCECHCCYYPWPPGVAPPNERDEQARRADGIAAAERAWTLIAGDAALATLAARVASTALDATDAAWVEITKHADFRALTSQLANRGASLDADAVAALAIRHAASSR
ncbi:Hypothetical protein A7982_04261 [Minicystis rosea]|nr:Hypothetical protein A7982_04261 [Minicystis rosea]